MIPLKSKQWLGCLLISIASFLIAACGVGGGGSSDSGGGPNVLNLPTIFADELSDNKNLWFIEDTENSLRGIANGSMTLVSQSTERVSTTTLLIPELEYSEDFVITASLNKVSGSDRAPYGIIWGMSDIDDAHFFLIYGDESYIYLRRIAGEWVQVVSKTSSSFVNEGNRSNFIQVQRSRSALQFFINGSFVKAVTYAEPSGVNVGIYAQEELHIELDRLVIQQEPESLLGTWERSDQTLFYVIEDNNQFRSLTAKTDVCNVLNTLTLDHRRVRFSSTSFSILWIEDDHLLEFALTNGSFDAHIYDRSNLPDVCSTVGTAPTTSTFF